MRIIEISDFSNFNNILLANVDLFRIMGKKIMNMSFDFFSFLKEVGRINEKKENHNRWPPTPRRRKLEKNKKLLKLVISINPSH